MKAFISFLALFMRTITLPLAALLLAPLAALSATSGAIDRQALLTPHNIEWNDLRGQVPLGNGEFCFNVDATGLQTFGGSTMSHIGPGTAAH